MTWILFFIFQSFIFASDCHLPFSKKMMHKKTNQSFTDQDVWNNHEGLNEIYQNRYLVLNLNTVEEKGSCKGVQELYPGKKENAQETFPELKTEIGLKSYVQSVLPYYTAPGRIFRFARHHKQIACVGQSISLCELRDGEPYLVAHLVTSSLDSQNNPPPENYYAAYNRINTRSWAVNRALYSSLDGDRDRQTGGVTVTNRSGDAIFARYLGQWIMPNFMNYEYSGDG